MSTTHRRGRTLSMAALSLLFCSLIAAAHYFAYIFFQLYLEPWFWPSLAGLVTLAVLCVLMIRARRDEGIDSPLGAVARSLIFSGPLDTALPALIWVFWSATLLMAFRQQVPYLVWPLATAALSLAALVATLARRRRGSRLGLALPIVALALSIVLLGGKIFLDYVARKVDESSRLQLADEIDRMIEEALLE